MRRRDVSALRKSPDIFLTSKALIKKGAPDANDAPTTAVSPDRRRLSLLHPKSKCCLFRKIPTPQRKGKTKCIKVFLLITHLSQHKGKADFVSMCLMIYMNSNHNKYSKT